MLKDGGSSPTPPKFTEFLKVIRHSLSKGFTNYLASCHLFLLEHPLSALLAGRGLRKDLPPLSRVLPRRGGARKAAALAKAKTHANLNANINGSPSSTARSSTRRSSKKRNR